MPDDNDGEKVKLDELLLREILYRSLPQNSPSSMSGEASARFKEFIDSHRINAEALARKVAGKSGVVTLGDVVTDLSVDEDSYIRNLQSERIVPRINFQTALEYLRSGNYGLAYQLLANTKGEIDASLLFAELQKLGLNSVQDIAPVQKMVSHYIRTQVPCGILTGEECQDSLKGTKVVRKRTTVPYVFKVEGVCESLGHAFHGEITTYATRITDYREVMLTGAP